MRVSEALKLVPNAEDEPPGPQLPPVVGLDALLQLVPAEPLLGRLLYRDTLAQIAGAAGSFKSFIAVGIGCAIASGKPWGQHEVGERAKVLYVAAEGGKGVGQRAAAWCLHYGIEPSDLFEWFYTIPEPVQLANETHVDHLLGIVEEMQPDLVILDTRARVTVGLEENSATDQGEAIENAERVRRSVGCTVLVVHHTGKNGTQRGTTAWPGAIWSDLTLERTGQQVDATGKPLGATVTVEKHKDAEIPGPKSFDMVAVEIPPEWMPNVTDPAQLRSLVAVPTDAPHTSVARMEDRRGAQQQATAEAIGVIGAWLREQHAETGTVPGRRKTQAWMKDEGVGLDTSTLSELIRDTKKELTE
ncbi:AAA family ATPase [Jongsikchunia kroppenstedtii]|uniref:AAA family ATPase n=1 Tax=Jongsikchunia kroppenstedtii TaxID=1121721 RepID=UPI00036119BC|nr:AAA family ATPase [Jongsikchunia kroppenstedtii]